MESQRIQMKIIKYYNTNNNIKNDFVSSKSIIPQWYKDVPNIIGDKLKLPFALTVKSCMPFLDSLSTGYMILTSQDIMVKQGNEINNFELSWRIDDKDLVSITTRNGKHQLPVPLGYREEEFIWKVPFNFKLPLGYSLLILHPANRYDLPFITTSGVVDCDTEMLTSGKLPFFMSKNFQGIIPAGTPIAQIIPFKRDNWIKQFDESLNLESEKLTFKLLRTATGFYKKNIWSKKTYQ